MMIIITFSNKYSIASLMHISHLHPTHKPQIQVTTPYPPIFHSPEWHVLYWQLHVDHFLVYLNLLGSSQNFMPHSSRHAIARHDQLQIQCGSSELEIIAPKSITIFQHSYSSRTANKLKLNPMFQLLAEIGKNPKWRWISSTYTCIGCKKLRKVAIIIIIIIITTESDWIYSCLVVYSHTSINTFVKQQQQQQLQTTTEIN